MASSTASAGPPPPDPAGRVAVAADALRGLPRRGSGVASAVLLVLIYLAVRATGGVPSPLAYFGFVAVALAVFAAGWRGGIVSGLVAGVLLGPLAPDHPASSLGLLGTWDWQVRLVAYVVAGASTGWLWDEARRLAHAYDVEADRRRTESRAHASAERLRQTIEGSADGVVILDQATRLVLANEAAERILGRSRSELVGRSGVELMREFGAELEGSPTDDPRGPGEISLTRPDGTVVSVRVTVSPLADDAGGPGGAAVTLHDTTVERSLADERSVRLQVLDEVAHHAVSATSAAAAGEWLLAQLTASWSLVASAIYLLEAETTNRLAAYSPPEVGGPIPALVPEREAPALRRLAAGGPLRLPLGQLPAPAAHQQLLSDRGAHALLVVPLREGELLVGVLMAGDRHQPGPLSSHELDELGATGQLAAAIVRRAEHDEEAAHRRTRDRIEHLLAHHEHLEPVFQPILSVNRWQIVGYEGLARFRTTPIASPVAWFADAVAVGLSPELQALAIRRVRAAATRARLPADTFLSVNVRPQDLAHPLVARALGSGPLERLVIEVTEDEPIADYAAMRAEMRPYLDRGARFAVDDAGAGFASMRHVTELHPDFVKLDAQLVRGLGDDAARQALVRALVGFAAEVGAQSVAEGVEHAADLALLARTGLPVLAQGFAIARPGPAWPAVDLVDMAASANVAAPPGRSGAMGRDRGPLSRSSSPRLRVRPRPTYGRQ